LHGAARRRAATARRPQKPGSSGGADKKIASKCAQMQIQDHLSVRKCKCKDFSKQWQRGPLWRVAMQNAKNAHFGVSVVFACGFSSLAFWLGIRSCVVCCFLPASASGWGFV